MDNRCQNDKLGKLSEVIDTIIEKHKYMVF